MTIYRPILFLLSLLILGFTVNAQVQTASIQHDGETRNYRYYVPTINDNTEDVPLVFVLHGLGDSSQGMLGTGFNAIADTANFIAVYPDALSSFGGTAWNSGTPLNSTVDDVGFFAAILSELGETYQIDIERVYSCGFSMGGIMSHRLACEWNDVIRAVASQSGCMATSVLGSCAPGRSVAVLHIHGTEDATVAYDGTPVFGLSSVAETIDFWSTNNACDAAESIVVEDSAADGYTVDFDSYGGCTDSQPVHLYTVNGMGHTWMGPSNDITTSVEMWKFFSSLDVEEDPVIVDPPVSIESAAQLQANVYPNPTRDFLQYEAALGGSVQLLLFDPAGKLIRNLSGMPAKGQLAIDGLASGTYRLHIIQGEHSWKSTVVKQ